MKIGDQITECILMHNNISKQEAWDKAVEMLKLTGVPRVERMMKEYPFQLSGGQRQRVMKMCIRDRGCVHGGCDGGIFRCW